MDTTVLTKKLVDLQNELFQFAYKLTSDYDNAQDLLQDTSLKVLNHQDMFVEETNFKGWVYTIMRNIFINNYRKEMREQTFVDKTEGAYFLNQANNLAYDSTESNHDLKEIRRIVNALPSEYKVPFYIFL